MDQHSIEIRDVVSVGKFRLRHKIEDGAVFNAHYMIVRSNGPKGETGYAGILLEFALFSWGATEKEARFNLAELMSTHLEKMQSEPRLRKMMIESLRDEGMEKYWGIYRQIMFIHGDSSSNDLQSRFEMLSNLLNEKRVDDAESLLSEILSNIRDASEKITEYRFDIDGIRRFISHANDLVPAGMHSGDTTESP